MKLTMQNVKLGAGISQLRQDDIVIGGVRGKTKLGAIALCSNSTILIYSAKSFKS